MSLFRVYVDGALFYHPQMSKLSITGARIEEDLLPGKAVVDAKEKAMVLTKTAGVSLKDIQSIDYSWGEINFEYSPMRGDILMECCEAPMAKSYNLDIKSNDIDVSDTAAVIWKIG